MKAARESAHPDLAVARKRLVPVVQGLAREHRDTLVRLKEESRGLERPDFLWHYLLQSFATMGRASGRKGLIENEVNYRKVQYPSLEGICAGERERHVRAVCRAAAVRMPDRKAAFILGCFERIHALGGPEAAKADLLSRPGRDAKIRFLQSFPGIGPKYARNIMMDVYHPEFRECIAVDSRIGAISEVLGLSFRDYSSQERFYLAVAHDAGLDGWEVDRILFHYQEEVETRLGVDQTGSGTVRTISVPGFLSVPDETRVSSAAGSPRRPPNGV